MRLRRTELTELSKRATPEQWAKFITSSPVIKIIRDKEPRFLYEKLTKAYYEERRHPRIGLFFDSSKTRKGRQSLQNRLLLCDQFKLNGTYQINL